MESFVFHYYSGEDKKCCLHDLDSIKAKRALLFLLIIQSRIHNHNDSQLLMS